MKNYRYIGILLVFVVMAAVSLAGCTSTSSPSVTATPAATSGTQSVTATPTSSSGGILSTLGSAFDLNKVHWYEYQMSVSGADTPTTMKMKQEFNVNYDGATADKTTMNSETKDGDEVTQMAMEYYSDKAGNSLGGHYKITVNGQVAYESDMMAGQTSNSAVTGVTATDPFEGNDAASLTTVGTETVTVPAGTFACTKYTVTETDGSGTVWVSTQAPVPVKYESKNGGETYSMVLTGWG